MAFVPEQEESQEQGMNVLAPGQQTAEQQQQQAQQGQDATQPMNITGQSQSVTTGAPTSQQPQRTVTPVKNKPQGSGMFVNTQKYVEANKPQAGRIGQAVGKGLDATAGEIGQQIKSQQNTLRNQLDQNKARLAAAKDFATQAVDTAGSGSLQDPDFQRYQGLVTGDTQFDQVQQLDLSRQRAKAQALANLAGRAQSSQGRDELLQRTFAPTNRYTRGQRAIDALVLGSDPNVAKNITAGTQQQFQGIKDQIGSARQQALTDIGDLRTEATKFTGREGEAAGLAGGARDTLGSELDQLAANRMAELTNRRGQILDKLNKRAPLTFEEMDMLGIPEEDRGPFQAFLTAKEGIPSTFDYTPFLGQLDPKNFTRDTIANAEQRARYNELAKLMGQQGLLEDSGDPSLNYDARGAIGSLLEAMNKPNVSYSGGKFEGEGSQDIMDLFLLNPMLAGPLLLTDTVLPFAFDVAKGVVDVGGSVVKTAADVVSAINPAVGGAVGKVAGAIVNDGIGGAVKVAENVVSAAAAAAKSVFSGIFCFAKDVMVEMADGTRKAVQDLRIGDITLEGGPVLGVGQVMVDELYEYKGTQVTGSHAALEDGKWIRVEDSKYSTLLDIEDDIVYPVVTANHVMIANGFVSADSVEVNHDGYLTPEERLDMLNQQDNSYFINKYEKASA